MDNLETVLQCLNDFEKAKDKNVGPELDELLTHIAKTGRTEFPWHLLKPVIAYKLERVLDEFFENNPSTNACSSGPLSKTRDLYPDAQKLIGKLNHFTGIPFTIQRLCELITEPKKYYKIRAKFLRAVEKNIMVVSTVQPDGSLITRSISTPITNGDLSPAKTETTQSPISPTITPVINSPLNTITQDQSSKTTTTPEEEQTEAQTIQNNPEDINICINKTQNSENKEEKQDIVEDIQSSESAETGLKVDENSVENSGKDSGQSHVENGEKIADTPEEIVAKGEMPTEEKTTSQVEKMEECQ